MRETVLQRNGKVLERVCATKQSHPQGFKLFLQLKGNTISGGIAGVSEIHATLPEPQPIDGRTRISITTQNFAPHDEAGVVQMQLCN